MKPTPQAIENAARALCRAMGGNEQYLSEYYASHAEAVLSCDLGDMVLAPKQPTEAMKAASSRIPHARDEEIYRAVIAAADGERCK